VVALIVRSLVVAALVWLTAATAAAQPGAPIVEAGLRLHAVAKRLASPADAAPALHWVAEPFPGAADVLVSDGNVKATFVSALAALAGGENGCPIWVLEISQTCTLGPRIERRLAEFSFHLRDHVDLLDPPDMEGKELNLTLRVDYLAPSGRSGAVVRSLEVRVTTERARGDAHASELTVLARDAAARSGAPAPALLDVPITVTLTESDRARPDAPESPFTVEALQNELLRAGLQAVRVAADHHVAINSPMPADDELTAIDDAIRLAYRVERPSWSAVRSRSNHIGDQLVVELTDLRFVSRLQVQVHAAVVERENGRVTFQGTTPSGEARLVALRAQAAQQAMARLAPIHLEGTLPSAASIGRVIDELRKEPRLGQLDVSSDPDGTITFSAPYLDIESELTAKADLAASLDPEQLWTGSATVHGHNLLYLLVKRDIRENIDLGASGGPQVQTLNLDVTVSRDRGTTNTWTFGGTSRTFFMRDANQRYGNLPPIPGEDDADSQLVDRQWGQVPKAFLQFARTGRWHNRLRWEGDLDSREVLIRPRLATLAPLADGHLTAWDNTVEERLSRDFMSAGDHPGGGVGEFGLEAIAVFRNATRQLGGDFEFSRSQFSATVDTLSGWRTRREILARYAWLSGSADDETPAFQQFRLGGPTNVRGLEAGEYVGLDLGAQQFTLGIGLPVIIPALGSSGGSPLESSYLTTFYDRGRVTSGDVTHEADGYGIGIELRNLPAGRQRVHLAIGWARSPQSVLHPHGVMMMGVHFSF
jgi:hypothetical protein